MTISAALHEAVPARLLIGSPAHRDAQGYPTDRFVTVLDAVDLLHRDDKHWNLLDLEISCQSADDVDLIRLWLRILPGLRTLERNGRLRTAWDNQADFVPPGRIIIDCRNGYYHILVPGDGYVAGDAESLCVLMTNILDQRHVQ